VITRQRSRRQPPLYIAEQGQLLLTPVVDWEMLDECPGGQRGDEHAQGVVWRRLFRLGEHFKQSQRVFDGVAGILGRSPVLELGQDIDSCLFATFCTWQTPNSQSACFRALAVPRSRTHSPWPCTANARTH